MAKRSRLRKIDIDKFEKIVAQMQSIHQEISALVRKAPSDAVNKFKLDLINSALSQFNDFFGEMYRPFDSFNLFSDDDLPSNSDVSFVVANYLECAEKFRSDHIRKVGFDSWVWDTDDIDASEEDGGRGAVPTSAPRKLTRK